MSGGSGLRITMLENVPWDKRDPKWRNRLMSFHWKGDRFFQVERHPSSKVVAFTLLNVVSVGETPLFHPSLDESCVRFFTEREWTLITKLIFNRLIRDLIRLKTMKRVDRKF